MIALFRMAPSRRFLAWLGVLVVIAGVVRGAAPAYRLLSRYWAYQQAKHDWQDQRAKSHYQSGDVVLWLRSDVIGLDTPVFWGNQQLARFPGFDSRSSLPGDGSLGIILGHRDAHFRALGGLRTGDTLKVDTKHMGTQWYWVRLVEILPESELSMRLAHARHHEGLVLVTCFPLTYMGAAPKRLLIWLEQEPLETKTAYVM